MAIFVVAIFITSEGSGKGWESANNFLGAREQVIQRARRFGLYQGFASAMPLHAP